MFRRGRKIYEPPRFMTVNQALEQLLEVEEEKKLEVLNRDTQVVGLARVGQSGQRIVAGPVGKLLEIDFGPPLHSLVIPGETHFLEQDMLKFYSLEALAERGVEIEYIANSSDSVEESNDSVEESKDST
eukprot:TRINITY_DN63099_c0_g1_i3.p1 TRINITY_DN63099_c0_g1~~TRINITY_DN63099_c0_g1_i3.p1  ORF type:complete len:129 (+),score=60.37 TRINITY_DN63099_c0_g1_i3:327-713(+)